MDFIPKTPSKVREVPYFDDVTSEAGWSGHSTSKSMETLKAEITQSLSRLDGMVTGFQRGTFVTKADEENSSIEREGFHIHYAIETPHGQMIPGRLSIAALPVRSVKLRTGWDKTLARKTEQSLKMALYMTRDALDGAWYLMQLSPGYAPLIPWLLNKDNKTVTQLWSESAALRALSPPDDSEFEPDENTVEGEYKETD